MRGLGVIQKLLVAESLVFQGFYVNVEAFNQPRTRQCSATSQKNIASRSTSFVDPPFSTMNASKTNDSPKIVFTARQSPQLHSSSSP